MYAGKQAYSEKASVQGGRLRRPVDKLSVNNDNCTLKLRAFLVNLILLNVRRLLACWEFEAGSVRNSDAGKPTLRHFQGILAGKGTRNRLFAEWR